MRKLNKWLQQLMTGKYGTDELSSFLAVLAIILFVFAVISMKFSPALVFLVLMTIVIIWNFYRIFSHDYARRQGENLRFLRMRDGFLYHTEGIRRDFRNWWNSFTAGFKNNKKGKNAGKSDDQRLKYCIFPCPGCGAQVRVPANKGRIQIRCPKCGTEFIRNS